MQSRGLCDAIFKYEKREFNDGVMKIALFTLITSPLERAAFYLRRYTVVSNFPDSTKTTIAYTFKTLITLCAYCIQRRDGAYFSPTEHDAANSYFYAEKSLIALVSANQIHVMRHLSFTPFTPALSAAKYVRVFEFTTAHYTLINHRYTARRKGSYSPIVTLLTPPARVYNLFEI